MMIPRHANSRIRRRDTTIHHGHKWELGPTSRLLGAVLLRLFSRERTPFADAVLPESVAEAKQDLRILS